MVGRRDRLEAPLVRAIECAEARTKGNRRMRLRMAVDYSARDVLTAAVQEAARRGERDPGRHARRCSVGR